jgi:cytoskeletal protein CcmA (bactofilin family)
MNLIHKTITNDLQINEEVIIYGIVEGNIVVNKNGNLVLDGHCKRYIVIQEGGKARIAGKVDGYIFNLGGELLVDDIAEIGQEAIHLYGLSFGNVSSVQPPDDPNSI